jgi:tetratricopeptide (TPR) repeat protein
MTQIKNERIKRSDLSDIVYITIPDSLKQDLGSFTLDPSHPLPVQIPEGSDAIETSEGIKLEMIAAGIIRIFAFKNDHPSIAYYRELLLALQPDVEKELVLAAISKANLKDFNFAEELFLAANHINPTAAELYVNLSVLYGQRAKLASESDNSEEFDYYTEKQVRILQEGLRVLPLSDLLLSEIGMLNLFLGNEEIGLEFLQKYLRIAPESEKRTLIEARVKEVSDKIEDDRTLYEAFDEMQLGNEEQALRLIETLIDHKPKVWSGWFIKGWALRRLENYVEAQKAFIRCLELGEKNADIYNELSICSLQTGEKELAKSYLDIALELDESNVKLITNLAFLHLRDEEYNQVFELYQKARTIDPEDPAVIHLGQELDKRLGDRGENDDVIDA